MIEREKQSPPPSTPPAKGEGKRSPVMTWVVTASTVLTLLFGLQRVGASISETRSKRLQASEVLATAKVLQRDGHYEEALAALQKAEALGAKSAEIRAAEEDVAMEWTREAGVVGQQTFADVVNKVQPILARGASTGTNAHRADLTAHLGWADFLLARHSAGSRRPEEQYRRALELDSMNVYAHTMFGHWILWHHASLEHARAHFAAALRSGNNREFVRDRQIRALVNANDSAADVEMFRVANEMRAAHESMTRESRRRVADANCLGLSSRLRSANLSRGALPAVVSPQEDRLTLEWLFTDGPLGNGEDLSRDYCIAVIEESAGRREEALALYKSVGERLPKYNTLHDKTDAAIRRLSKK